MRSVPASVSFPAICLTALVLAAGCGGSDDTDDPSEEANPASVFCVEQGGSVDIVDDGDGEAGICEFPDGTRVDEWDYFRENSPDATTP
ncbi:putative hemolysin [Ilumatobacter nonamiensis]|uniref:putative hemolysin n=1 Tax=Ilumatobacter nonamiensis TaxID=467093 RepID=UPI00034997FF|nr:DUF333 domain-containing protein [Ilumatobacter nonamiensis]